VNIEYQKKKNVYVFCYIIIIITDNLFKYIRKQERKKL
jgi:hypothetical protein